MFGFFLFVVLLFYVECVSGGVLIINEGEFGKVLGDSLFILMYLFVNNY